MTSLRRLFALSAWVVALLVLAGLFPACGSGDANTSVPDQSDATLVDEAAIASSPTAPPATAPVATPPAATPAPANPDPTSEPVSPTTGPTPTSGVPPTLSTRTGAGSLVDQDFAPLHGLRVGLIAHRASVVDGQPLAELLDQDPHIELTALFAPEHGLYGTADAGSSITDAQDPTTGAPVYSLYGVDRAPTAAALADVDVLVYDLQDVGVRFYTYTSTLGLAMQAAAAADVRFMVLDRPNPIGGDNLQGPTLSVGLESFIGMYNVPSAYGLTSGELAMLIKNQGLVAGAADLDLTVITMQNWSRTMRWHDTGLGWIPPSPNLPTADSALIYPGTVLFEATSLSEGRGTDAPFQLIGASWIDEVALAQEMTSRQLAGVSFEAARFTPRSIPGAAASPRFQGQELAGVRVNVTDPAAVAGVAVGLHLLDAVLRHAEAQGQDPSTIINRPDVFDRLAGTSQVRSHLLQGDPVDELVATFTIGHDTFRAVAENSLLYPTD